MDSRAMLIRFVAWLSHVSEDLFRVPGTSLRFGLDAVVGFFVPGWGDVVMSGLSLFVVAWAYREGVAARVLWRMLGNVALDLGIGIVPFVGDAADFMFRSNQKNARLLDAYFQRAPVVVRRRSWLVAGIVLFAGMAVATLWVIVTFVLLLRWLLG